MRLVRPTRAALAATGLFILACGGLGDTGLFEEPYCEVDCPHGAYEVADNESSDQCTSTCAPLAECPPWGIPQVTEECYSCAHIAEDGKLLPLLPNIGYGSLEDGCDVDTPSSGLHHVLMWVDEEYRVGSGSLRGSAHIRWTSAVDQSLLCDVAYSVSEMDLEPSCEECDAELAAALEFTDYTGRYCDALLTDHRLEFAERANGGSLLLGFAYEWTSWDGRTHDDVVFRYDYDVIYDASTWIPYSQAAAVVEGDRRDGLPRTLRTHELWSSEWVALWSDPYDSYRTTHPAETTVLGLPVSVDGRVDLVPPYRLHPTRRAMAGVAEPVDTGHEPSIRR